MRWSGVNPWGVMREVLDCGLKISEFELRLRYCVHVRTYTSGKGKIPLFFWLWVKSNSWYFIFKDGFSLKKKHTKVDMLSNKIKN